jgi:hypothetical protein
VCIRERGRKRKKERKTDRVGEKGDRVCVRERGRKIKKE